MKRRILSFVLCLCMFATLLPSAVMAEYVEAAPEGNEEIQTENQAENGLIRYTVLILDTSGSMDGVPLTAEKAATVKFCNAVLSADGTNYVGIVDLNTNSSVRCNFISDAATLETYINDIVSGGGTNIDAALTSAKNMLSATEDKSTNVVKNIVLCSDGIPEHGYRTSKGPYTQSQSKYYTYANGVYNNALELKKTYSIYTLGFFHSLTGSDLTFGRTLMNDIQNAGYYEVTDVEKLEFTFGQVAEDVTTTAKKGTYYRTPSLGGGDKESEYYYTDAYFYDSAYKYNPSLATMSLCFALSSFASNTEGDYEYKSRNAEKLLTGTVKKDESTTEEATDKGLGFSPFEKSEDFKTVPGADTIGVVAASKPITDAYTGKNYTLIAVGVRGGGYGAEWASNFTIGVNGQHQGFDEASKKALEFLKNYINNEQISGDVKLWITGYSRAAATANLLAGAIDQGKLDCPNISVKQENVFAYCFETPAGALTCQVKNLPLYGNIFNIINSNDPVAKVAPTGMGFCRYGIDYYTPTSVNSNDYKDRKEEMLKKYNSLKAKYGDSDGYDYAIDNFQMQKIKIIGARIVDDVDNHTDQSVFLDRLINVLVKEFFLTRVNYVENMQETVRLCCVCCNDGSISEEIWNKIINSFVEELKDNWAKLNPILHNVDEICENIRQIFIETCNKYGVNPGGNIASSFAKVIATAIYTVASHPNYTVTAISNLLGIKQGHYTEICLAWLQSQDVNYGGSKTKWSCGDYRVVHINCPVDVEVYSENNLVGSIYGDVPQDGQIITSINEDGEKLVYLPADGDYDVKLKATDNGTVNVSVQEFSAQAGEVTRVLNYYDIPVETGDVLTGSIPKYSDDALIGNTANGTNTVYTLSDANSPIAPSKELSGSSATSAYYKVSAVSNNDTYGTVTGQGVRQEGEFALLTATPNSGYKFDGWYENGKLISSDLEYRTCVKNEISLTAKFSAEATPSTYIPVPAGTQPGNSSEEIKEEPTPAEETPVEQEKPVCPFTDVAESDFYYAPVMWAVDKGVTTGKAATLFAPIDNCTRAEVVTFLWRAMGSPEPSSTPCPFTDVAADAYYYKAVMWAVEKGVTTGTSDTTFAPDKIVTRAEFVTFLWRASGSTVSTAANPFADMTDKGAFYYNAVLWAVENGITTGTTATTFGPADPCTRGQVVTFLYRGLVK